MQKSSTTEEERIEDWTDVVSEITFDWERHAKPRRGISHHEGDRADGFGGEYINVYKTTFFKSGLYERKGNWGRYDPTLWPRLEQFVELMLPVGEKL